jgi:magnesium transporter
MAIQVGLVLMHNCLISFQERRGDLFDQLRARLQDNKAHLRAAGVDYLFYRLMDTIVDNYFFVTEHLSSRMEQLEEKVLQQVDQQTLAEIQQLKKLIMRFKRLAVPLREPSMILYKEDLVHIKKSTRPFLRDVYEHVMQVQESVEIQREAIGGLMELYHSGVSQRTNQIMQVLTIISTIFIPLTFIAGIYGMNFKNMPELSWPFGYAAVWGLMLVITVFMLIIFRRKKWL